MKLLDQLLSKESNYPDNQLVILPSPSRAESIYVELQKSFDANRLYLLPHSETLPYDFFSSSSSVRNRRMRTLSKLLSSQDITVITSIQCMISPCPDKLHLLPVNKLNLGDKLNRNEFIISLISSGYKKNEIVSDVGEFSVRGSIIDLFTTGLDLPVRIEIDEDTIESLRFFDPLTQLTTTKLKSLSTLPSQEYPLNEKGIKNFKQSWRQTFDVYEEDSDIFRRISIGKSASGAEMYLPFFFKKKINAVDYLHNFKQVFLDSGVYKALNEYKFLIEQRYEEYRFDIKRPLINPRDLFFSSSRFSSFLEGKKITEIKTKFKKTKKKEEIHREELIDSKDSFLNIVPKIDELVVHLFHGIGLYKGLKQIKTNEIVNECLEIEYFNDSKIYVPAESMHLVSKYFGPDDISLDTLGSKKWKIKKVQALKKTYDTAAELLELQAKRDSKRGNEYKIPKKEYKQFCNQFPYNETPDQNRTISEIEVDLESSKPMDRLVCGEVGFGKTEVAMRASFITAFNNYQTCLLVPTTLLAQQHFESFIKRFADTAIIVEKISRDVPVKKRRKILKELEKGNIDILIGTHAILQKSVKFVNLGLLIIDEEHKFGVRQKEKIKQIKQEVNLLYLSATPIPRTLNFALSELKDFSIIATAPNERLPVKTFTHKFNLNLIKECIQREMLRGGQVYYLCNDLSFIEDRKQRLQEIFKTSTIEIVHGKLKTNVIEDTMILFQKGEIDILLCSTIIESGLDFSNANTLIIEEADKLGLAQLHQIRGRVGRGDKQAYAYFLKSRGIIKRKAADSRLKALEESDSLAAGFLLAIKDIETRGVGEILGTSQSGIMESIGIDLYIKLLNKAVDHIKKGILNSDLIEKNIDIDVDLGESSYIPDSYLPDVNQRLVMYNKISSSNSEEELKKIQLEMINRFGLFPEELTNLFYKTELSFLARENNVREIRVLNNKIIFKYSNSLKERSFFKGADLNQTIKNICAELNSTLIK